MKRKAKQSGSGGRLRFGLLMASVAAFLLVPAASAFAAPVHGTIEFEGSGSGWVKGLAGLSGGVVEGGQPLIECHWNGTEIDVGTGRGANPNGSEGESGVPGLHECTTWAQETAPGLGDSLGVKRETDLGSVFEGWMVVEGTNTGCTEPTAPECTVASFGGSTPIKIKAKFGLEPTPPHNISPPTVSGTAKVGKTLIRNNPGTWEGNPAPSTFTYQWLRCNAAGEECSAIAGAEGTSYEVTEEDTESTLRFEETADNGVPPAASAQSAQTAVVPKAGEVPVATAPAGPYGEVEPTTSLLESTCGEVFLGIFKAGEEKDYENSCTVVATSTGQESTLSAADENPTAPGYLVNGAYSLAQLLQVQGTDTESLGGVSTGFKTVATSAALLNWAVPVSADTVQVDFKQPIGKHDPLHTGTYSKVITLTLEQTLP